MISKEKVSLKIRGKILYLLGLEIKAGEVAPFVTKSELEANRRNAYLFTLLNSDRLTLDLDFCLLTSSF